MSQYRIQRLKFQAENGFACLRFRDDKAFVCYNRINGFSTRTHNDPSRLLNLYINNHKYETAGYHVDW